MKKISWDDKNSPILILSNMKQAQLREGVPSQKVRADRISRVIALLLDNRVNFQNTLIADYGHRSRDLTDIADIASTINELHYARANLKSWIRPFQKTLEFPLKFLGAKGQVQYQPKGVVGVMSPWNFPLNLAFAPLAGVLAAGNRAMIKPSEFTPETSTLMAQLVAERFDADELHVITGGPKVGAAFSALPFDHLLFTGSTSVGRQVMRAAADNLVPVTLELGGKSPVIIGASADPRKAATGIMHGKVLNAGQICIAPDYVLLVNSQKKAFVDGARDAIAKMFPSGLKHNDDYTSLLGKHHYDRLQAHLEDARKNGAEIIEINPKNEDFSKQEGHKLPPILILGAKNSMSVMQEEIFGPLLPVCIVSDTAAAVDYVNAQPRPLALYFFGKSSVEEQFVLDNTTSGGVTVNDTIMHISQNDLPFGGVGPSGMGRYHGHSGFLEFSHHKAIFKQTSWDFLKFLRPPYGSMFNGYLKTLLKR